MQATLMNVDAESTFASQMSIDEPYSHEDTVAEAPLHCAVCRRPFALDAGEAALVLRHTAYGYDFVHNGACLKEAREMLFLEPGYDGYAFGRDTERRRVLAASPADGWSAVLVAHGQSARLPSVRFEPLRSWVVVEHQDGSLRVEGLVRDDEWLDESGGAEFPEAARGGHEWLGYTAPGEETTPARRAVWEARALAHLRGLAVAPSAPQPVHLAA